MHNETIAAIATPLGEGALGIVRISGNDTIKILGNIFKPKKDIDIATISSHTVHYGHIVNPSNTKGATLDEVLVTLMRAPQTYTREDLVEITCHGNPTLLQKILDIVIQFGARLAEPGEFTKRAFLNGRIDLSQAESVIEVIRAKTDEAANVAIKHLSGDLSSIYAKLQDNLKEKLMLLEAEIDFPEEETSKIDNKVLNSNLSKLIKKIEKLVDSFNDGQILTDGIQVAIIGKVNAGKSSLFNLLLDSSNKALVTPIPGTTRDILEGSVIINGRTYKFTDTAGLKKPRGLVEKESLNLTHRNIDQAQFILFIVDNSKTLTSKDISIWNMISKIPHLVILNKTDLKGNISFSKLNKLVGNENILKISCKNINGINELKKELYRRTNTFYEKYNSSNSMITNIRHKELLNKSMQSLYDALTAIKNNLPIELIATDIRYALENIQEITGEKVTDKILDEIFSKFCIGK